MGLFFKKSSYTVIRNSGRRDKYGVGIRIKAQHIFEMVNLVFTDLFHCNGFAGADLLHYLVELLR
ncbi:hypothetical protein D3C86_2128180 [compost metagenome]